MFTHRHSTNKLTYQLAKQLDLPTYLPTYISSQMYILGDKADTSEMLYLREKNTNPFQITDSQFQLLLQSISLGDHVPN